MIRLNRVRAIAGALVSTVLALSAAVGAQAQTGNAVITGKVLSEFGQPIDQANVYINELTISVGTNAQGTFTINIPAARAIGQAVNLRVRAIGYQPGVLPIRVTAGSQTQNFTLKQDINRLNEVVVTGSIEATERSKVPFAVGRVPSEDIPVPALDPLTALAGQGRRRAHRVRRAASPGTTPEILMRGPDVDQRAGPQPGPADHRRRRAPQRRQPR